jgi:hypothetical protein
MKENATLTDLICGVETVRRSSRKMVPRQSSNTSQIGYGSHTRKPRRYFWFLFKWSVFSTLFCAFIWGVCEAVQRLREMAVR